MFGRMFQKGQTARTLKGRYLSVGMYGEVYLKEDGSSSFEQLDTSAVQTNYLYDVIYANGRFVVTGKGDDSSASLYNCDKSFVLYDGMKTLREIPYTGSYREYQRLSYGGGRTVTVGINLANPVSKMLLDGAEFWTELTSSALKGISSKSVAYGNGMHMTIDGYYYAGRPQCNVFVLRDGANVWESHSILPMAAYALAYGNGRFVAINRNNDIYQLCDNETSWEKISPQIDIVPEDIAYHGGKFVVFGQKSISYMPDGGTTWCFTDPINAPYATDIKHAKDSFVCVSGYGSSGTYKFNDLDLSVTHVNSAAYQSIAYQPEKTLTA